MRTSARLLKRALSETDERSKLEGELVSGIEVVKCSAWEVRALVQRPGLHCWMSLLWWFVDMEALNDASACSSLTLQHLNMPKACS